MLTWTVTVREIVSAVERSTRDIEIIIVAAIIISRLSPGYISLRLTNACDAKPQAIQSTVKEKGECALEVRSGPR